MTLLNQITSRALTGKIGITPGSLLSESPRIAIVGSRAEEVEMELVRTVMESYGKCIVIDPVGLRRRYASMPEARWAILGWNAGLPMAQWLRPVWNDPYFLPPFIARFTAESLGLNRLEERLLLQALIKMVSCGELSIEKLRREVEALVSALPGGDRARCQLLLESIDTMCVGRLGAALMTGQPPPSDGLTLLDLRALPPPYKYLVYSIAAVWAVLENACLVMVNPFPTSPSWISLMTEFAAAITEQPVVVSGLSRREAGQVRGGWVRLMYVEDSWVVEISGRTYILTCPEAGWQPPETVSMPQALLKPAGPRRILLLEEVFGQACEIAYKALSFLREGSTTREGLSSYLSYAFSIRTPEALRLITKMMAYGLVEETVGRDAKYWLRLTIRGYSALEEYESTVKPGDADNE